MNHVAWNCDGKKLAAVGIDKLTRVWNPEKNIDARSATNYAGGHVDDVDYISWNPTHPDLFATSSQKEKKLVFWDARRACAPRQSFSSNAHDLCRESLSSTGCTQAIPCHDQLLSRWSNASLHVNRPSTLLCRARSCKRRGERSMGTFGHGHCTSSDFIWLM